MHEPMTGGLFHPLPRRNPYIAKSLRAMSKRDTERLRNRETKDAKEREDIPPLAARVNTLQEAVQLSLKEGSLVVNSSQGGGTKDTWVLEA